MQYHHIIIMKKIWTNYNHLTVIHNKQQLSKVHDKFVNFSLSKYNNLLINIHQFPNVVHQKRLSWLCYDPMALTPVLVNLRTKAQLVDVDVEIFQQLLHEQYECFLLIHRNDNSFVLFNLPVKNCSTNILFHKIIQRFKQFVLCSKLEILFLKCNRTYVMFIMPFYWKHKKARSLTDFLLYN